MNAQKETIIKIKSVYKNNFIKGADTLVPRARHTKPPIMLLSCFFIMPKLHIKLNSNYASVIMHSNSAY